MVLKVGVVTSLMHPVLSIFVTQLWRIMQVNLHGFILMGSTCSVKGTMCGFGSQQVTAGTVLIDIMFLSAFLQLFQGLPDGFISPSSLLNSLMYFPFCHPFKSLTHSICPNTCLMGFCSMFFFLLMS